MALIPGLRATGRVEVMTVARRDAERMALVQQELQIPAGYTDWQEMIEQVALDAVIVCTPNAYHVEPTIAALQQGLHVFVENHWCLLTMSHRGSYKWHSKQTEPSP